MEQKTNHGKEAERKRNERRDKQEKEDEKRKHRLVRFSKPAVSSPNTKQLDQEFEFEKKPEKEYQGDSLPWPYVTRKQLDRELDDLASKCVGCGKSNPELKTIVVAFPQFAKIHEKQVCEECRVDFIPFQKCRHRIHPLSDVSNFSTCSQCRIQICPACEVYAECPCGAEHKRPAVFCSEECVSLFPVVPWACCNGLKCWSEPSWKCEECKQETCRKCLCVDCLVVQFNEEVANKRRNVCLKCHKKLCKVNTCFGCSNLLDCPRTSICNGCSSLFCAKCLAPSCSKCDRHEWLGRPIRWCYGCAVRTNKGKPCDLVSTCDKWTCTRHLGSTYLSCYVCGAFRYAHFRPVTWKCDFLDCSGSNTISICCRHPSDDRKQLQTERQKKNCCDRVFCFTHNQDKSWSHTYCQDQCKTCVANPPQETRLKQELLIILDVLGPNLFALVWEYTKTENVVD